MNITSTKLSTVAVALCQLAIAATLPTGCRNTSAPTGNREAKSAEATEAEPVAASSSPEHRTPSVLARDEKERTTCQVDSDCVITCRRDGSCCLEQCGCSEPMSRAFLGKLERHLAVTCGADPLCPMAGCVGTKNYAARCEKGQCERRGTQGEPRETTP